MTSAETRAAPPKAIRNAQSSRRCRRNVDPIGIVFLGTFRDGVNERPTDIHQAAGAIDDHAQRHLSWTYGGDWAHGNQYGQYVRDSVSCHAAEQQMASAPDVVNDAPFVWPLCFHTVTRWHMRMFSVYNDNQSTYWVLGTPHLEYPGDRPWKHCIPNCSPGHPSGFDAARKHFTAAFNNANDYDGVHEVRTSTPGDSQIGKRYAVTDQPVCNRRAMQNTGIVAWIRWGKIKANGAQTGPFN